MDFVAESPDGLTAIEVKSGSILRPADRRGLPAFHDAFPDARLLALTNAALPTRQGPVEAAPLSAFFKSVVPEQPLRNHPAGVHDVFPPPSTLAADASIDGNTNAANA